MAAVLEARRLTEAHRAAQARLGAVTIVRMRAVWPLLDVSDLDGTITDWLTAAVPLVQAQRTVSARLAGTYVTAFKALEVDGFVTPVRAGPAPTNQVETSLLVTGAYQLRKALARGVPLVRALSTAEATSAAAAMRHTLNGGRETILRTVDADPDAHGWARVTSGKACAFCAMLAARGPVYRSQGTADFNAHDHCSCAAEPSYRRDAAWPATSRRYAQVWQDAKAAEGDTFTNFRRLIEAA